MATTIYTTSAHECRAEHMEAQLLLTDAIEPECETYTDDGYWQGSYGKGCS